MKRVLAIASIFVISVLIGIVLLLKTPDIGFKIMRERCSVYASSANWVVVQPDGNAPALINLDDTGNPEVLSNSLEDLSGAIFSANGKYVAIAQIDKYDVMILIHSLDGSSSDKIQAYGSGIWLNSFSGNQLVFRIQDSISGQFTWYSYNTETSVVGTLQETPAIQTRQDKPSPRLATAPEELAFCSVWKLV